MPERVDFYILDSHEVDSKLVCACKIAGKAFSQGMKVYIQSDHDSEVEALDALLWSYSPASFVPHRVIADVNTLTDTPVLLGTMAAPAGWQQLLISLTRDISREAHHFSRIADMTSAEEQDKQAGRNRFKAYRQIGIEPETHHLNS